MEDKDLERDYSKEEFIPNPDYIDEEITPDVTEMIYNPDYVEEKISDNNK